VTNEHPFPQALGGIQKISIFWMRHFKPQGSDDPIGSQEWTLEAREVREDSVIQIRKRHDQSRKPTGPGRRRW